MSSSRKETRSARESNTKRGDTQMGPRTNGEGAGTGPRSIARNRQLVCSLALLAMVSLGACDTLDELLEAELPGQVTSGALDAPELAETLVAGAQADFECGFQGHLLGVEAGFANVFQYVIFQIEMIRIANRQDRTLEHGVGECASNRDPIWFIMHRGRAQAADAADRILNRMDPAQVNDLDFLVGKAYAYEGYATQILAEAWCEMVLDGSGTPMSRTDAMAVAEDRFTSALQYAQAALTGGRAAEAQDIVDLALVGRARSRLNQGDVSGALADAEQVTPGFTYYATYETSPARRASMVERLEDGFNVHPRDRNLMVGGVPDPRVPIEDIGLHPSSGVGAWIVQRKYADDGTDIPFASWREAQLMIAELDPARTVAIINSLRSDPTGLPPGVDPSAWPLPAYVDAGPAANAAAVLEERRRELYLQGVAMGDAQRTGSYSTWDTGVSPVNAPIGNLTCLPIPEVEFF